MSSSDDEGLAPMGEALATVNSRPVFWEARRQYEELVRRHDMVSEDKESEDTDSEETDSEETHSEEADSEETVSEDTDMSEDTQPVDLVWFYRELFNDATYTLDNNDKTRLLTICLAYKTKDRVMKYLELLDDDTFDWVRPLKFIVSEYGKDTLFGDDGQEERSIQKQNLPPWKIPPHFVITTLPLAYPGSFFASLANMAPLDLLTPSRLLAQPSALVLALSQNLKIRMHDVFIRWAPYTNTDHKDSEVQAWSDLASHLLRGRASLPSHWRGIPRMDHGELGYEEQDLKNWVAMWRAERQSVGVRERGQELVLGKGGELGDEDLSSEDDDKDSGVEVDTGRAKKRRVSWNEDMLVQVRQISPRPDQAKKVRMLG